MMTLVVLLFGLGLIAGVHAQICALSGRARPVKTFTEFLLSMLLIGAAIFAGILQRNLTTFSESVPLFVVYLSIVLVAAMLVAPTAHWVGKMEKSVFGEAFSARQCEGCIDCFAERIRKLSEASRRKHDLE